MMKKFFAEGSKAKLRNFCEHACSPEESGFMMGQDACGVVHFTSGTTLELFCLILWTVQVFLLAGL